MFLLDANVLIFAFRRGAPEHAACHAWLAAALGRRETVATTSVTELALIRIGSMPGPRGHSVPPAEAFRFLASLHAQPTAIRVEPRGGHGAIFEQLCAELGLRGNDVNDAWLAALALEHAATLVTHDRGFTRFPGLVTLDPVTVAGLHEPPADYAAKRLRVTRSARP